MCLATGVWLILERIVAQEDDHDEARVLVDKHESRDQPKAASLDTGQDNLETSPKNSDVESDLTASQNSLQADLGLEDIVREFVLQMWGGETVRTESDYVPSTYAKLESADLETRRRGEFERAIRIHLFSRQMDDPHYLLLHESRTDGWWSCLQAYDVPPLEEFGQLTQERQDAILEELGLVGERMEQVQDDCWGRARIYTGKDEETDRLLELQHQYYLSAAEEWVNENPDAVVFLP